MIKSIKQILAPKDELRVTFQGNLLKAIVLKSNRLSPEFLYLVIYRNGEFTPVYGDLYDEWEGMDKVDPVYLNLFHDLIPALTTLFQIPEHLSVQPVEGSDTLAKLENEKMDQLANKKIALVNMIVHTLQDTFLRLEKELLSCRNSEDFSQRIRDAFSRLQDTNRLLQSFEEMDSPLEGVENESKQLRG